jgi:hypothetical protein
MILPAPVWAAYSFVYGREVTDNDGDVAEELGACEY